MATVEESSNSSSSISDVGSGMGTTRRQKSDNIDFETDEEETKMTNKTCTTINTTTQPDFHARRVSMERTREISENNNDDTEILPVKVPIVGFETMEERAKFTVFKLRVENAKLNESWLVFRRYTDFVRLHTKLKDQVQNLQISLPPKRWLRDNFETVFLEERMKGLQAFVDSILVQPHLEELPTVRKFFCLDEPPNPEAAEDSRSWNGSIEESCVILKHRLADRDREIELLRAELALVTTQKDNLCKVIRQCKSCTQRAESICSPCSRKTSNPMGSPFAALPSSSSSSDHGSPRRLSTAEHHQHPSVTNKRRNNSESSFRSTSSINKNGESHNGIPGNDLSSLKLSTSSPNDLPITANITSKDLLANIGKSTSENSRP